jgi:hypothetical protein
LTSAENKATAAALVHFVKRRRRRKRRKRMACLTMGGIDLLSDQVQRCGSCEFRVVSRSNVHNRLRGIIVRDDV